MSSLTRPLAQGQEDFSVDDPFGLGAGAESLGFKEVGLQVVEDNQKRDPREGIIQIVPTSQTPVINPAIEPGTSRGAGLGEEFTNDLRRGFGL